MKKGQMRIVSWNCNEGFWNKWKHISKYKADIYVICECGNPATVSKKYGEFAKNYIWVGEDKNKGLGIFANEDVQLELIPVSNKLAEDYITIKNEEEFYIGEKAKEGKKIEDIPEEDYIEFRHFIPVKVTVEDYTFNLLAVWAMPEYVEMIHDFYDAHKELFSENLIMCGDLNSSILFDERGEHKGKNFGMLIRKLKKHNLVPVYHSLNNKEKHGHESEATYFYKKKLNSRFHIDHVFSAPYITKKLKIIDNVKWIKLSDHLPLVFEIDESKFD